MSTSTTRKDFEPKNAVVTGAAMGLGRSIALRLAKDGLNVVVNDLEAKSSELASVVKEIEALKAGKVTFVLGDVTAEETSPALVKKCVEEFGSLDVMVCNAGTAWSSQITETSFAKVQTILDTNFKSMWLGYSAAATQMIKQNTGGRIIGACSTAGKKGFPFAAAYCASKFAVRGLTQSAAQEWGQNGITVNTYCPGLVRTPLIESLYGSGAAIGDASTTPDDAWAKLCALRRVGDPEDIAGIVSWLASKDAAYVTGQNINVDGGGLFD
ncbi:NAD-binding protein [Cylindrobasidium torrendii FP15055 ss-10]|uniref:NAD-binding protein n=1 Tax=Cylindrobasidium torrendii FP15055 ss-10 TaxID=1314674 RepID=A0A0D7B4M9_9AGAR|nr:NAD-binding protein [Cylindrobasidium torrendii FP15055 ss-10]